VQFKYRKNEKQKVSNEAHPYSVVDFSALHFLSKVRNVEQQMVEIQIVGTTN
jgi:hypothetical protein